MGGEPGDHGVVFQLAVGAHWALPLLPQLPHPLTLLLCKQHPTHLVVTHHRLVK